MVICIFSLDFCFTVGVIINLEASSLGFLMQKFLFRTNLRLDILYCDEALILKSLEVWNSKRGIDKERDRVCLNSKLSYW